MVKFEEFQVYFLLHELQHVTWVMVGAPYALSAQSSDNSLLKLCECVQLRSAEAGWADGYHSSALTAHGSMSRGINFVIHTKPCTVKDIFSAK